MRGWGHGRVQAGGMMTQSFGYPNLAAGTDVPTEWFEPPKGKPNTVNDFYTVNFPRPLAEGDVVATTMTIEADGLDVTASGGKFTLQGQVWMQQGGSSWTHYSPLTNHIEADGKVNYARSIIARGIVFDGLHYFDNVCHVTSAQGTKAPIGAIRCTIACRIDNCGGAPPCASAHGHAQRGWRPACVGTGRGGGVAEHSA